MGWGKYLVISRNEDDLTGCVSDALREGPAVEASFLRPTAAGVYLSTVTSDCSIDMLCSACSEYRCVGCGLVTVFDLDQGESTCRLCDPEFCLLSTIDALNSTDDNVTADSETRQEDHPGESIDCQERLANALRHRPKGATTTMRMQMNRRWFWATIAATWTGNYFIQQAATGFLPLVFIGIAISLAVILWAGSCRARHMGNNPHTTWLLLIPLANIGVLIWLGSARPNTKPSSSIAASSRPDPTE